MQNKGIVMKVAGDKAIVMTKDCQFLNIPLLDGMTVGQEIDVPEEVVQQSRGTGKPVPLPWYQKTWNTTWKKAGIVAASVLLAVSVWTSASLFSEPTAYAYVTVDINPSIELSIDNHKQVVAAVPLNDEGKLVLEGLKLKGLPVEEAVGKLAEAASTQGYLDEKTEVIITASPAVEKEELEDALDLSRVEDELVAKVESMAQSAGTEVEVEGIVVSQEVRAAAQEEGLSPGKYALYLAAVQNGIEVEIGEFKTMSITKLVEERGQKLAEVLHDLKGGEQLDDWHRNLKNSKDKDQTKAEKGIVPSGTNNREQEEQKTPPGQRKKEDRKDDSGKDDRKGKDHPSQGDKQTEREQDDKRSGKTSKTKSDDKENDRSKGNRHEKEKGDKGKDRKED
jgi:hypothetical protein